MMETLRDIFGAELSAELEKQAKRLRVKAGEPLLEAGQTVRVMPLVLSGLVEVSRVEEDGRELLLYYINPNEGCAMTFTCCMQAQASKIRAVAAEDSEILALPVRFMEEWMAQYPEWKRFVMRTIQLRFQELLRTIDQVAFHKLDERLVFYLREKSRVTGSALINLSHEEIASDLASSRVVISRLLKKLEDDGKLLLYRNQVKLLSAFSEL
ncbi:MAG: Crp/Fnr family transcriptional regulator [Bacteroidia bacterium]|nr:Crp/Fnr family transcriptional regulator [Bacteroidia bacterium]